jgi:hypothetical protein
MINTSSTYTTIVIMILATILPHFGISLGNDVLTNVVQGLVEITGGLYVYYRHKTLVTAARAAGVN